MEASGYPAPATQEAAPTTDQLLQQLLEGQAQHRAEVKQLRDELAEAKSQLSRPKVSSAEPEDPQVVLKNRLDELASHPYYCPSCGKTYDYMTECNGRGEAPHAPVVVVSTDELKNRPDPDDKTAFAEWQASHTAAPNTDTVG